jgi:hypothetical protein
VAAEEAARRLRELGIRHALVGGLAVGAHGAPRNTAADLQKYDMVLMSCGGSQSAGRDKTTAQKQNLKDFVDAGGRVLLEHYQYAWIRGTGQGEGTAIDDARRYYPTPFPLIATWDDPAFPGTDHGTTIPTTYAVQTSFPKGSAFADWLVAVGASSGRGLLELIDARHPAWSIVPPSPPVAQDWIDNAPQALAAIPYLSVDTPIESASAQRCGKLAHTASHFAVAVGDVVSPFPSGCVSAPLTSQEKPLEFLFFELSSCVE